MRTDFGMSLFRQLMATGFSAAFFILAFALGAMTFDAVIKGLTGSLGLTEAFLKAINM